MVKSGNPFFSRLRQRIRFWRASFADSRPISEIQAGAVPFSVVNGQTVFLLITSRGTGKWIFPKGGLDGSETPWDAAAEEAYEEAGVRGQVATSPVGTYRYVKIDDRGERLIAVEVFALQVTQQFDDWPEKRQRHRHWATLPEARRLLSLPALADLAAAVDGRVRQPGPITPI